MPARLVSYLSCHPNVRNLQAMSVWHDGHHKVNALPIDGRGMKCDGQPIDGRGMKYDGQPIDGRGMKCDCQWVSDSHRWW